MSHLFVFGLGYTALALARRLIENGWTVAGTARTAGKAEALQSIGIKAIPFDGTAPAKEVPAALDRCDHVLISVGPGEAGDPVLGHHRDDVAARAAQFRWLGYLSTVGVYGDHAGGWVDEETPLRPSSARSRRRAIAEQGWHQFGAEIGAPVAIFRLAGIYGPGRNQMAALKESRAKRIVNPEQVFNRIHVDDIAITLMASIERLKTGRVYNLADDHPAPPQEVVAFAAELMGVEPPPEIQFDEAQMTPMARSFYCDNKRVCNARIKQELGVRLAFPDYKAGLEALYAAGEGR